jgi:hypothetical protein
MIDPEKLIEWLGMEGAIAGLDGSDLTSAELSELMPEPKLAGHSKLKRRELIKALVEKKRHDLTKKPEELMTMDANALKAYFLSIKASKKEILDLLESWKCGSKQSHGVRCSRDQRHRHVQASRSGE